MIDWTKTQWQAVLTIKNGKNQKQVANPNGAYPIYGSGGVMGYADDYLCDAGTTVIGRKGSINNPLYVEEKFWNVDTAFGLCAGEQLDCKFLYYFCITYNFLKHNPLAEQKKIVAILDAADQLRQKDQQLIDHYTSLSQSLFLEMFGDSQSNKQAWNLISLGDLCSFENGDRSSNYPSKSELLTQGKLFLSSADIRNGYFEPNSSKFISEEKFESLSRGKCKTGDVLMTLRGNGLGRTCVFECQYDEGFINAQMVILRPDQTKCTPRFLVAQLNNEKVFAQLLLYRSGSAQPQFSAHDVKKFRVLLPPVELQTQFTRHIQTIEQQKKQVQTILKKSDALFNSLLQRAFKGELTNTKAA